MKTLRLIVDAVRGIGLANSIATIRYTRLKEALDRRLVAARPRPAGGWTGPGRAAAAHPVPGGLRVGFEAGEVRIRALAGDLVEITWKEPLPGLPVPGWQRPEETVRVGEGAEGWTVSTGQLDVTVAHDGRVTFREPGSGRVLREELPPLFRGEESRHRVVLGAEERFHGLGGRAAPLDLRGGLYRMWNRDPQGYGSGDDPLYLCIPVYLCRGGGPGYLAFYANSHPAEFDFGRADPGVLEHRFEGGGLRYYLALGPAPRALERYTELTGRPPLPPLWALGYHQCRWSYFPESRVRKVAADFARHRVSGDAVHLDIHYMDGYRVFTLDRRRFPDLGGLARDLRNDGLRLVVIIDPGVKKDPDYSVYREGTEKKAFLALPDGRPVVAPVWPGLCVFPDFGSAEVRRWWGGLYRGLLAAGVAGFWHDMNEPAAFSAGGDPTLPLATRHSAGDHRAAHNLYGLDMAQAGYDGLRGLDPERRPFIVSRSGWAGLQRYAWNWTGDIRSDWASLRQTVTMVTALGLAGIPFSGSDVGGFIGDPGPELYIRWLQAAAFHPFFRSHTSLFDPDQEPWSYGEPYTTIARDTIRLRYALLPYIYTLAWEASRKGWPLVRPLFWGEAGGVGGTGEGSPAGGLPGADDSFLLGDSLLVAPVTEPGATSREVPVPPGLWYDYWTDTPIEGPATVRLEAPLDRLPLLVRAGTVLPAEDPAQSTSARRMDRLYLHLYPPAQAGETALRLYSDSGDGAGPYRLDDFILRQGAGGLELEWAPVSGDSCFPWPYGEVVLIAHPGPGKASGTGDDGRALAERVTAKRPGRFRFTPEPGGSVG